jgi:hypothetical protein
MHGQVTAAVCFKNIKLFPLLLFAEMNIPGIPCIRTKILNKKHGKTTLLRNNVSDIITHCLYEPFFRTRRTELYLWENKHMWE